MSGSRKASRRERVITSLDDNKTNKFSMKLILSRIIATNTVRPRSRLFHTPCAPRRRLLQPSSFRPSSTHYFTLMHLVLITAFLLFTSSLYPITIVTYSQAQHLSDNILSALTTNPPDSDDSDSKEPSPCETCTKLVESFKNGLDETARGKHEGGDTSWEEKNLRSYSDSEVRLVEIQERLCEDVKQGRAQCLSLAEEIEFEIEEWWFKHRNKNVRLHDYLCISKLKVCCPQKTFGPNCSACPSDCNDHGRCDGEGTRSGTGDCICKHGYEGTDCQECADDHFRIAMSDGHFACRKCDHACKGCYGPGQANCTECRSGYHKNEANGCVDINECETGVDPKTNRQICTGNTYCINTDGSYRCVDCHVSCLGCVGYGPSMCILCARGYKLDSDYVCRSLEELERMGIEGDTLRLDKGKASPFSRCLFYIGILVLSAMMFRSNMYLMFSTMIGFMLLVILSEFVFDEIGEHTEVSPE